MAVPFTRPSPTPTPLFVNRFQPLEELLSDEEDSQPQPKFLARGVYKPPHMRATPQPHSTANDASSSDYGSSLDREKKGPPYPRAPTLEFSELKQIIHEELLIQRRAVKRLEAVGEKLLKKRERIEKEVQGMKKMGMSDEEIQRILDRNNENSPSVKPFDIDRLREELLRMGSSPKQDVEKLEGKPTGESAKEAEDGPANKTPTPRGPVSFSADHPTDIYRTANYGCPTISAVPVNIMHHDTFMCQAGWNGGVQAYPEVANFHGSLLPVACLPSKIYQTTPGKRFGMNPLPPRFREPPVHHQYAPPRFQDVVPNWSMNASPGPPAVTPLNHTVRPVNTPPPPRPYYYEVDSVFDFEGVARSTGCNRDEFVKTYWKTSGFSPSQAAWVAWARVVERVKQAQNYEQLKAIERDTKERHGAESRLQKWCSNLLNDTPGPESGDSSASSDASTKVESLTSSEADDEGSTAVNVVGLPNWKWGPVPRAQRPWKDVADETWAFGEPPRLNDEENYMTCIVEKRGWQVHSPRTE